MENQEKEARELMPMQFCVRVQEIEANGNWNKLKSYDVSDEWWEKKIKENEDYIKFKNKDLSLIWFRYDKLFSKVVEIGKIARAPSQIFENEFGSRDEMLEDNGESNRHKEEQVKIGNSDDIEDGIARSNTNSGKK
ncbi:hypothetical protein Salat_2896600 [Sesamum alatum]|uniref:Uncharacterized protein n=1 Tax=Sesamum alatum TaxID=300844 RepID=A0AAE1XIF1_9LAMI|nr:hypothetical protein Salat_2896600 [Sesamum alatum]